MTAEIIVPFPLTTGESEGGGGQKRLACNIPILSVTPSALGDRCRSLVG